MNPDWYSSSATFMMRSPGMCSDWVAFFCISRVLSGSGGCLFLSLPCTCVALGPVRKAAAGHTSKTTQPFQIGSMPLLQTGQDLAFVTLSDRQRVALSYGQQLTLLGRQHLNVSDRQQLALSDGPSMWVGTCTPGNSESLHKVQQCLCDLACSLCWVWQKFLLEEQEVCMPWSHVVHLQQAFA